MAERIIAHRKSQTYLHSVLPVRNTHEELVKKKLQSGKFLFTITGLIKIAGIVSWINCFAFCKTVFFLDSFNSRTSDFFGKTHMSKRCFLVRVFVSNFCGNTCSCSCCFAYNFFGGFDCCESRKMGQYCEFFCSVLVIPIQLNFF